MIRPDKSYTEEEAHLLDMMLMLHAEHGGGNNSTFVCRALSSSGMLRQSVELIGYFQMCIRDSSITQKSQDARENE